MTDYLPGVVMLLLLVPLLIGEGKGLDAVRVPSKALASAAFIVQAWWMGALASGLLGVAVFVGLCWSALGDVLLLSRNRVAFLAGLVAFLIAHLAYMLAFASQHPSPGVFVVASVPLAIAGGVVWRWLAPGLRSLAAPVVMYVGAITAMVGLSIAAAVSVPSGPRLGMLASAVLFWMSDLTVARDRFVDHSPWNRYVGLPLYYVAQLGFAVFVVPAAAA